MTYLWPITHPCLCHVYDLLHIHCLSRVYGPWCIYGLWHIYHPWCIYGLTLMASALPSTHGLPTSMTYGVSVANAHPIPYKLPINFLFVPPAYCACLAYYAIIGHYSHIEFCQDTFMLFLDIFIDMCYLKSRSRDGCIDY